MIRPPANPGPIPHATRRKSDSPRVTAWSPGHKSGAGRAGTRSAVVWVRCCEATVSAFWTTYAGRGVRGSATMNFVLDLKKAESKKGLRQKEEIKMLGAEVKVNFCLPDGTSFTKIFRMGNLVERLKAAVLDEVGVPLAEQELYLGSKLMADPLMLRDILQDPAGAINVTVKVLSSRKLVRQANLAASESKNGDEGDDLEYVESSDDEAAAASAAAQPAEEGVVSAVGSGSAAGAVPAAAEAAPEGASKIEETKTTE